MSDYTKKTLQMQFTNSVGKTSTLTFPYPKEDLTEGQIQTVMNTLITKNILQSNGGDLSSIKDGGVVQKTFTDLIP